MGKTIKKTQNHYEDSGKSYLFNPKTPEYSHIRG